MSDYEDTSFIANGPDGEMHWYSYEALKKEATH